MELIDYNKQLNDQKDGTIIYICGSAIRNFMNQLPNIKYKFILVSGDSDTTIPVDVFCNNEEFFSFINNPHLLHWYSQNCIIDHPKMTRIPIGMDYHTLSVQSSHWGKQDSPIEQENQLLYIKSYAKPFWERIIKCYSNFHFHFYKFGQDRKDAIDKISSHLIFYEPNQIERLRTWQNQSQYAFVVSPHGNGLDCHRTWEALLLGCIVIVKKSGLDSLYSDLPVLIVNDWGDITENLLRNTIENFKLKSFNYNKLSLSYWVKQISKNDLEGSFD